MDPTYDYLPLPQVRELLLSTGYPPDRLHLVEGLVESTIPASAPDRLALLRLDTDYYTSTRHELEHLAPRLSSRGVLLVDDYGHWRGAATRSTSGWRPCRIRCCCSVSTTPRAWP